MELEWSLKVPPETNELRVSRIPGSLQRRFESRALRAVTLGALGREQSDEKRENTRFSTKNTVLDSLAFRLCFRASLGVFKEGLKAVP